MYHHVCYLSLSLSLYIYIYIYMSHLLTYIIIGSNDSPVGAGQERERLALEARRRSGRIVICYILEYVYINSS